MRGTKKGISCQATEVQEVSFFSDIQFRGLIQARQFHLVNWLINPFEKRERGSKKVGQEPGGKGYSYSKLAELIETTFADTNQVNSGCFPIHISVSFLQHTVYEGKYNFQGRIVTTRTVSCRWTRKYIYGMQTFPRETVGYLPGFTAIAQESTWQLWPERTLQILCTNCTTSFMGKSGLTLSEQ